METRKKNIDKSELLNKAYTMGYECYEHSYTQWGKMLQKSENPSELWLNGNEDTYPISDLAKEGQSKNSHQGMIWEVEDKLNFDRETQDWDNEGIYGIIEDCSSAWDSGAYDALLERDYNPDSVLHLI
jgi:hypothetical protein